MVWQQRSVDAAARVYLDRDVERIHNEAGRHFAMPLHALNGLRAMLMAQGDVGREAFGAWVASRNLPVEFPGVHGLGLVERVGRSDLAAFVEAERCNGAPDFELRGLADDDDDEMHIVRFIEPLAANRAALGLDAGRDAVRRDAIARARASGAPTLSARITLP